MSLLFTVLVNKLTRKPLTLIILCAEHMKSRASSDIIHIVCYNYGTSCLDWVAEIYGLPIKRPLHLPKVIPSWTLSYTIKQSTAD